MLGLCAVGGVALYIVRPLLHRYFDRYLAANDRLEHTGISTVLVLLFGCALVTSQLGLHALIGGFILGVALHQHRPFVMEWKTRLRR